MPSAAFTTLGCKVNQYETQRILDSFEAAGFAVVPFDAAADVYVINSCSVTSVAESKSRYTIRRAARTNPAAKVVVTGCAAQMALNKHESMEGADVVVPNPEKLDTLSHLFRAFPEFERRIASEPKPSQPGSLSHRTRATLKIQDGCSIFCSYCSIPFTRPGMVSRPAEEVVEEAQRMVELGFKEVVLTGVLIGAYGPETGSGGPDFEGLLDRLNEVAGLERIRISSIEMRQVTPALIERLGVTKIVPHLHIPLQSGDSGVLADMNRPYTQSDYLDLCQRLYKGVPDISITADVMVGFPTETEERFESSLYVCREARYLKAHVFRFSPRFGTPADRWGDPVTDQVKQQRSLRVAEVSRRTGDAHVASFVGRTLRVLVETRHSETGVLKGLADNYVEVRFAGPASLLNQLTWVRIAESANGMAFGELAEPPQPAKRALKVMSR